MKNKMTDVRNHMIEAMENLLDSESDFDVNKAKAVANLGNVLVKSAKVEVDYLRTVGGTTGMSTGFMDLEEQKTLIGEK